MRLLVAAVLSLSTLSATAQVYRWTDEKGQLHVTDTPPPATAKDVRKSGAAPKREPATAGSLQLRQAQENFPIKLYTSPECKPCAAARALLNERGLPFTEVSVLTEAQVEEVKQHTGKAQVPVLLVGGTIQDGLDAAAYDRLLDNAGYPKAGDLPSRNQLEPKAGETVSGELGDTAQEDWRPTGPYAPGAPPQRAARKK